MVLIKQPHGKSPLNGEVCSKCGKKNHFLRMCIKHTKMGYVRFTKESVAEMEATDDDIFEYDFLMSTVYKVFKKVNPR